MTQIKTTKNTDKEHQGFTFIELLIVLLIIGILSATAYPSYLNYILRSHRADAFSAIAKNQIILERCYAQNLSYNRACEALSAFPQTSPQGFYSIAISNRDTSTYTLRATPLGTQIKDTACASMTVTQANVKSAVNNAGVTQTKCWTGS